MRRLRVDFQPGTGFDVSGRTEVRRLAVSTQQVHHLVGACRGRWHTYRGSHNHDDPGEGRQPLGRGEPPPFRVAVAVAPSTASGRLALASYRSGKQAARLDQQWAAPPN